MHYFIVTYDVCDEKRIKKVFKLCKNFGRPIQYSVFICRLSEENYEIFKSRLISIINEKEDQVMFIRLRETSEGNIAKNAFSIIGKQISAEIPNCWVIT
ncbi:CRISPR-associated endonuclease Cas2 [Bullifex sp.]|uniref:CRISPR-associated endonuclease Cas2 n=1 Tax=Bullifex sp. TaxID=2815808 RepID=UPI002A81021A|nr:CRISPR-associated endonuclease Cas2 [Bullifex sp.]MDY4066759.1 CRISPR-associated endonuclease Cas2 [Bullifex sp.]